jgi:hypothetical protein
MLVPTTYTWLYNYILICTDKHSIGTDYQDINNDIFICVDNVAILC